MEGTLTFTMSAKLTGNTSGVVDRVEMVASTFGINSLTSRIRPDDNRHAIAHRILAHPAELFEVLRL